MSLTELMVFGINQEQAKAGIGYFIEQTVGKGMVIFAEKDPGGALYIVGAGRVAVYKAEVQIGAISRGSTFGEMSLLDGRPRSATCIAEDQCHLLKIDGDGMRRLAKERPDISSKIYENIAGLMAGRLRRANEKLAEVLWLP